MAFVIPEEFWRKVELYNAIYRGDIFYPYNDWPAGMCDKMFRTDLNYTNRVYVAAFGYYNGLDREILLDILDLCNPTYTQARGRKIFDLYSYWGLENADQDFYVERRSRYFTYCMLAGLVVDLNGNPRQRQNEDLENLSVGSRTPTRRVRDNQPQAVGNIQSRCACADVNDGPAWLLNDEWDDDLARAADDVERRGGRGGEEA